LGFAVTAGHFSDGAALELAVEEPGQRVSATNAQGRIISFSFPHAGAWSQLGWQFAALSVWHPFKGEFSAGDVTGDGRTDLLIGLPNGVSNSFLRRQGLVVLLHGSRHTTAA